MHDQQFSMPACLLFDCVTHSSDTHSAMTDFSVISYKSRRFFKRFLKKYTDTISDVNLREKTLRLLFESKWVGFFILAFSYYNFKEKDFKNFFPESIFTKYKQVWLNFFHSFQILEHGK